MNDNAQLAQETVVEFLKQEVIATLPWPACSPDLNPINGGLPVSWKISILLWIAAYSYFLYQIMHHLKKKKKSR